MNTINQKELGIYQKFTVTRTDGKDTPGEKHHGDEYFVLNLTTDKHAIPAISAYAESCKTEYPVLADDLRTKIHVQNNTSSVASEKPFSTPQLNEGEIYAGAIIKPDGSGNHIILLPGDNDVAEWQEQMDRAKSIGGDLPSRPELALLYSCLKDQFQPTWYWSNEQHESYSFSAWYQLFSIGYQHWCRKDFELRARAVRRVAI